MTKKCGYVALIGLPNAGKSTLLNTLIGTKVSIVCHKAQTTRSRMTGILTENDTQLVFLDTPGLFEAKRRLERAMVKAAWASVYEADQVVLVVDVAKKNAVSLHKPLLDKLEKLKKNVILLFNKVDRVKKTTLLPLVQSLGHHGAVKKVFMVSALQGDGVSDLKNYLVQQAPENVWLYPEDQLADMPLRLMAAEFTREQIYHLLHDELPYNMTVLTEKWEQKQNCTEIVQMIYVARQQHKAMVLGKAGQKIKMIGQYARQEIEKMVGGKVNLVLHVTVDDKWLDKPTFYEELGLDF